MKVRTFVKTKNQRIKREWYTFSVLFSDKTTHYKTKAKNYLYSFPLVIYVLQPRKEKSSVITRSDVFGIVLTLVKGFVICGIDFLVTEHCTCTEGDWLVGKSTCCSTMYPQNFLQENKMYVVGKKVLQVQFLRNRLSNFAQDHLLYLASSPNSKECISEHFCLHSQSWQLFPNANTSHMFVKEIRISLIETIKKKKDPKSFPFFFCFCSYFLDGKRDNLLDLSKSLSLCNRKMHFCR